MNRHWLRAAAMALKAETILALRLASRHRAPRVALLLAGCAVTFVLVRPEPPTPSQTDDVLQLIAGSLSAVAGSRPLAPGPARASAQWAVGSFWFVLAGRTIGVLLAVSSCTFAAALGLFAHTGVGRAAQAVPAAVACAAGVATVTLAAASRIGAVASTVAGLFLTWLLVSGLTSPSEAFAGTAATAPGLAVAHATLRTYGGSSLVWLILALGIATWAQAGQRGRRR
jgi:hypothetical protein